MSRNDAPASRQLTRRALVSLLPLGLAACAGGSLRDVRAFIDPDGANYDDIYGPRPDEKFPVPGINWRNLHPAVLRRSMTDPTGERPGTIVVDPDARLLYLVLENGRAMRYGVGVGKQGMEWNGRATIQRKAAWPTWTPTRDMISRDPALNAKWAGGMPGGLDNPLGARALYLYQGGRDTMYRIHGTNAPRSIGRAMSSGCVRMLNQDIIDLYERVSTGAQVVVLPASRTLGVT
ncbi:L,D-transpeptidase [Methylopila turkensis]|uniref:L,D-transpeptidase n=1 Tax=Methylopila turkensis TaxID=1437816 RepID=A0A9W6N5R1_9HYPH|nr:L,D-transpeptidase [Methylopila turkensis]GLK78643.1 L,D-transpeptidase [Methylopila turkensis]